MADVLTPVSFDDIPLWSTADLSLSLAAFQRSAREILTAASGFRRETLYGGSLVDWQTACVAAGVVQDPRHFFETWFRAFKVQDPERPEGLFTGYYEPLLQGALTRSAEYQVPVYARPPDLVAFTAEETAHTGLSYGRRLQGIAAAYDTRQDIENGSLTGKADVICWVSSWVDAFFMHVQGQGRVALSNGQSLRLSYAAKAGHPYTGIGHILVEKGIAPADKMSMQFLRGWMDRNPKAARDLMWRNKSYIFFQANEVADPTLGGIGAAKVNLTPLHSLAVDRRYWMFGTPLWVTTSYPVEADMSDPSIHRLMLAQDTGTAIKGLIRGDFFWGWGNDAELNAGHMKSAGEMIALLPVPLAQKLGHSL